MTKEFVEMNERSNRMACAIRSLLAVPCSSPELFEKAARSTADGILLDLEDSVPVDGKASARKAAIEAINAVDWQGKSLSLRVNGPDTQFLYKDVIDVIHASGEKLEFMMIPKVASVRHIHMVELLLDQVELDVGRQNSIKLDLLIESAAGIMNIQGILAASRRAVSVHFGCGDFAASIGAATTSIGGALPGYGVSRHSTSETGRDFVPGDAWHYPMMRLLIASRAAGLNAVDGAYGDFNDVHGLEETARLSSALGFDGKWAIHPCQIDRINEIFTPAPDAIRQAQIIIDAMLKAKEAGNAAVEVNGEMIDTASIRQAQAILARRGMDP